MNHKKSYDYFFLVEIVVVRKITNFVGESLASQYLYLYLSRWKFLILQKKQAICILKCWLFRKATKKILNWRSTLPLIEIKSIQTQKIILKKVKIAKIKLIF